MWKLSALLLLSTSPALAHIELDAPRVRHDNGDNGDDLAGEINKAPPCGLGGASDARNPARVTTFHAGDTITVQWRETVGHIGRNRISFDVDGDDLGDFDAPENILYEETDPDGGAGNAGGNVWRVEVSLPDVVCSNCTLQLEQIMITNDIPDPYYQCADLVLLPAEGEGEGPAEGEGELLPGDGEGETPAAAGGEGEAEAEADPRGSGLPGSAQVRAGSCACSGVLWPFCLVLLAVKRRASAICAD